MSEPTTEKKTPEADPPPPAPKLKPEELEARLREQDEELGRLRKLEQESKAGAEEERKKKLSEAEKLAEEKRQLAREKSQLALERRGVPPKLVPLLGEVEDPEKVAKLIKDEIDRRAEELAGERKGGGRAIAPSAGPERAPGGASGSSGGKDTTDWQKRLAEGNRWGRRSGR